MALVTPTFLRKDCMEFPHLVLARLYEHIEPIDRGARYEDPLQGALDLKKSGQVTGGGSQLNQEGSIEFADVEMELANLDAALDVVVEALEQAGAPQGSELIDGTDGRVLRTFGIHQCVAIYLDGVSLPDEVYADLDFEAVVTEIGAAAGPESYHGFSQGNEDTGTLLLRFERGRDVRPGGARTPQAADRAERASRHPARQEREPARSADAQTLGVRSCFLQRCPLSKSLLVRKSEPSRCFLMRSHDLRVRWAVGRQPVDSANETASVVDGCPPAVTSLQETRSDP
jgi:hypothetical protein